MSNYEGVIGTDDTYYDPDVGERDSYAEDEGDVPAPEFSRVYEGKIKGKKPIRGYKSGTPVPGTKTEHEYTANAKPGSPATTIKPSAISMLFQNDRYINQQAQAQEPDELYSAPASTIQHRRLQHLGDIKLHGHDVPLRRKGAKKDPFEHLIDLTKDMVHSIHELQHDIRRQIPRGQVYSYTFNFVKGNQITHIDFINPEYSKNIPSGSNIVVPQVPLFQIMVFNDGPGTIAYATNLDLSDTTTSVTLNPGESSPQFVFGFGVINTLNIISSNPPATVRIVGYI